MAVAVETGPLPWWESDGLAELPPVSDALPELPDWLMEDLPPAEPPACVCGLAGGAGTAPGAGVSDTASATASDTGDVAVSVGVEEPVRWAIPGVWDDEPDPAEPTVGELVTELQVLVGRLGYVDPVLLAPGQALGEAQALFGVQQHLRVLQLARTEDVTERRLFTHAGFRSTGRWLAHVAPDADSTDATLAHRLPALPHLHAALRDGRVSVRAGRQVAGAVRKAKPHCDRPDGLIDGLDGEQVVTAVVTNVLDLICRDRFGLESDPTTAPAQAALLVQLESAVEQILGSGTSQLARVEQAMVLLAAHLRAQALPHGLAELLDALLPSVLEDQEKSGQDKRALALSPNGDGTWELSGTLTAECGEQLHAALAAEARRDPANPVDTAAREAERVAQADAAGTDAWAASQDRPAWEDRALREQGFGFRTDPAQLVPRSRSKRLHDAFGRLLERYLSTGLGGVHGKVPVQLTATISERTTVGAPGAPPARGGTGRPLARSLIRRWWCDAHVTTLLMSRGWKPLGVVHSARTLTGTELKAALVQFDQRCAGDGCCPGTPDPLIALVPHHVKMHAIFGTTSLDETILACPTLHHDLHTGKKTIRLRDGRLLNEHGWVDK